MNKKPHKGQSNRSSQHHVSRPASGSMRANCLPSTIKDGKSAVIGTFVKEFYGKHGEVMSRLAHE